MASRKAKPVEGNVCWFCKQPADHDSWMGLGLLKSTSRPIFDGNYILYHEPCAVYSNGAGDLPPEGMDDQSVLNFWLHGEKCSGIGLKCQLCGLRGATTGCLHGPCQQFYHYPCARVRALQGHLQFSLQCRALACKKHLSLLPIPVEEQFLGMWMEGGGSWNGSYMEAAAAGWLPRYEHNIRKFRQKWQHLLTMIPHEELKARQLAEAKKSKRRSRASGDGSDSDPEFRIKKSGRSSQTGTRSRLSQPQVAAAPAPLGSGRISDPGAGATGLQVQQKQQPSAKKQQQQRQQQPQGVPSDIAQAAYRAARHKGTGAAAATDTAHAAVAPVETGRGVSQHIRPGFEAIARALQEEAGSPMAMLQRLSDDGSKLHDQQQLQASPMSRHLQQLQQQVEGAGEQQQLDVAATSVPPVVDYGLMLQAAGFTSHGSSAQKQQQGGEQLLFGPSMLELSVDAAGPGAVSAAAEEKGTTSGRTPSEHLRDGAAAAAASAHDGVPSAVADSAQHGKRSPDASAAGKLAPLGVVEEAAVAAAAPHDKQQQQPLNASATALPDQKTAPAPQPQHVQAAASDRAPAADSIEGGGVSVGRVQRASGAGDSHVQQDQLQEKLSDENGPFGQKVLYGETAVQPTAVEGKVAAAGALDTDQQSKLQTLRNQVGLPDPTSSMPSIKASPAAAAAAAGPAGLGVQPVGAVVPVVAPPGWPSNRGTDMFSWLQQQVKAQQQLMPEHPEKQQHIMPQKVLAVPAAPLASAVQSPTAAPSVAAATAASVDHEGGVASSSVAAQAAAQLAALIAKAAESPSVGERQRVQLLEGTLKVAQAIASAEAEKGSIQQPQAVVETRQHAGTAAMPLATGVSSPSYGLQALKQQAVSSPATGGGTPSSGSQLMRQLQQLQQQLGRTAAAPSSTSSKSDPATAALLAGFTELLKSSSDKPMNSQAVGSSARGQQLPHHQQAGQHQQQLYDSPRLMPAVVHRPQILEYFGCVTSLPALQPGELRVAGVTAHPHVVAAYVKQGLERALQLQPWSIVLPPASRQQLAVYNVQSSKLENDLYGLLHATNVLNNHLTNPQDQAQQANGHCSSAAASLTQQQSRGARLSGGYAGMPQDLPVRYVRGGLVAADDHRKELRGEFGLTATQDLEAGTILGPWRSYVLTAAEFEQLVQEVPKDWQEPPGSNRQHTWQKLLQKYTITVKVPRLSSDDPYSSPTWDPQALYFCALGHGNLTCLTNDPVLDPYAAARASVQDTSDCDRVMAPNVDVISVLLNGMPVPLMVTTRKMHAGDQVCYSYGREYWRTWAWLKSAKQPGLQPQQLVHHGARPRADGSAGI